MTGEASARAKRSKRKGANGEREFCKLLRCYGFNGAARNLEQSRDGGGDVLHGVPGLALEIKRVERLALPAAYRQAKAAAVDGEVPAVAHRRSREPWLVTVPAEFLLDLLRASHG